MGLALVIALVLVPISRSLVCVTQNNEYAPEWVGQALQPADPLCSGSSRPGGADQGCPPYKTGGMEKRLKREGRGLTQIDAD